MSCEQDPGMTRREVLVAGSAIASGLVLPSVTLDAAAQGINRLDRYLAKGQMYRDRLIFRHGQDPSAIALGGLTHYVQSVGSEIHMVTAQNVPDLATTAFTPDTVIWRASDADIGAQTDIWAPKVCVDEQNNVLIYGTTFNDDFDGNQRIFAIGADSAGGDYAFEGYVNTGEDWAIDGRRVAYQGRTVFTWSGKRATGGPIDQEIFLSEMEGPSRLVGKASLVSSPKHGWEHADKHRGVNEAPFMYDVRGDWQMDIATGPYYSSRYNVARLILDGSDPLDPGAWEKLPRPVLKSTRRLKGPGPVCYVTDEYGTWQILGVRIPKVKGNAARAIAARLLVPHKPTRGGVGDRI